MKGSEEKQQNHQRLLSCLYNKNARLQKFKRFSTAISISAPVERLFAVGSDILRSKRSSMTKENCEKFVLLRENEKCLKKSIFIHE